MNFIPLEPVSMIRRAVAIMENQAQARSIAIKLNLTPDLPKIKADETRFSQVMINLLDNAIKYTPENGSVVITANVVNNALQIDVADTGIGISEKTSRAYLSGSTVWTKRARGRWEAQALVYPSSNISSRPTQDMSG